MLFLIFFPQAVLDKATSHTQTVLQKTIEQKRALEKVFVTVGLGMLSLIRFKCNFLRLSTVAGGGGRGCSCKECSVSDGGPLDTYI